jgi:hypothetical protein
MNENEPNYSGSPQSSPSVPPPTPRPPEEQEPVPHDAEARGQGHIGPVVGIVIIIFVLAIAGLYFWGTQLGGEEVVRIQEEEESVETILDAPDPSLESLEAPLSESDSLEAISADVESTSLDNLDAEIGDFDEDLNF